MPVTVVSRAGLQKPSEMSSQSETARLLLRPWRQSDVAQWIAISAVSRLMEFFPYVRSRAEAEAEAERLRGRLERDGYGWWALEVKNARDDFIHPASRSRAPASPARARYP